MELRKYADPTEFLARVEGFLHEREAENSLMLGLCAGILRQEWAEHPPYLATVEDGSEIVLAATRTPPHNLVLTRCGNLAALDLLLNDPERLSESLPGVIGPAEVSEAFAARWRRLTGGQTELAMEQRIYQLDRVEVAPSLEGGLRSVATTDRELLIDWLDDFHQIGLGGTREDAARSADRFLHSDAAVRGAYFWQVDGKPVSLVGYHGVTPRHSRIGPVYTPPELRRRGFASAATAAVSQRLLDSGRRFCCLYADLANPTANHIYQEIGFRPIADSRMYRFALLP